MSRKHDPPNKAQLLRDNPRIGSTCELMVENARLSANTTNAGDASRASLIQDANSLAHTQARAMDCQSSKRGRKRVVTPERVQLICEALARGESEIAACFRAGIGLTAWNVAKRVNADLRQRIASARDEWARLRHAQHAAALYESQSVRAAGRKALKPQPIRQAKFMVRYLTTRVPLNFAAIPEEEITEARERCSLSLETWRRQERAFGLMAKIYKKRAEIRGQHPTGSFFPNVGENQTQHPSVSPEW